MSSGNWFGYVGNNPCKDFDPAGLRPLTAADRDRINKLKQSAKNSKDITADMLSNAIMEVKRAIDAVPAGQDDPAGLKALWHAIDHLGDKKWGWGPERQYKCNIFVYHVYLDGAHVAMPDRIGFFFGTQEYRANVLGDKRVELDHFTIVSTPQPGDIAAFRNLDKDKSGHTTLSVGGGVLIYAGPNDVKLGSYKLVYGKDHYPAVYRRHRGQ
jgi:cell wall-associated NlpC family hydrolase